MTFDPKTLRPLQRGAQICFVAAAAVALAACGKEEAPKPQALPPAAVKVVAAHAETVPVQREYIGTVSAFRSVQVRARVEGILQKRSFVEGSNVKAGDLLYTIDAAPYEAALRDAQAVLAQAEANHANARVRESRFAPLAKEKAISQQDYDDALTQLKQAEASVQAARASVDRARLNLGYTKMVATESGRIGASQVPEGALVGKGDATLLATIEKLDPIYVNFTMPDRDALILQRAFASGAIKPGAGEVARFFLPDGTEYRQAGRIDFTDAQVNRDTGTISLRAVLPNRGSPAMLPGMFVRVALRAGERPDTVLIPQKAVVKVPTGHVAFVVGKDNKVERRDLVVGDWVKDDWIVDKGIAAGDVVVVEGLQKIQPGATVNPTPYKADAAPAAAGAQQTPAAPAKK